MSKRFAASILIPVGAVLALLPFTESAAALIGGLLLAFFLTDIYGTKRFVHPLLALSVAGMGAGMNLDTVAKVGLQGLGYTVMSISGVCLLGFLLMRLFRVEEQVGTLITIGTAICGGSAIAAATPVLRAKPHSVSVALGTVFILNALALLIFPPIGHYLGMQQRAFGLWSALAIHDTSSVVGATLAYGKVASEVGTTVKLARALWIVPVTLALGFIVGRSSDKEAGKAKKPWFILWFLVAAALVTWVPALRPAGLVVSFVAKRLLVLTLFFIGLGLSKETIRTVGLRPLLLGVSLWIVTGLTTLILVQSQIIR